MKSAPQGRSRKSEGNAPAYRTDMGKAVLGDSLRELEHLVPDNSINLIVTSPPYALTTEKEYGNQAEDEYVEWFVPFADLFRRKLRRNGSLVLNIGGAWLPGRPLRSLYLYRLVLRLCEDDLGFGLCQEFFWYNPAKIPAPAEWVSKRRERVKDAVEPVLWLSRADSPPADNRRVLVEYSDSMKRLLKTKRYNWGERPSGHVVGRAWAKDNGGAIPPNLIMTPEALDEARTAVSGVPSNLLVESNTASQGKFFRRSREAGFHLHPARFPSIIPEFFIRFLTEPGDLVCDPFAGSNTTGEVAERMGRRWISVELNPDYHRASALRFDKVKWKNRPRG